MKIINLSQTIYNNYARLHSEKNFGQTIEYSQLNFNNNKRKLFLGLVDDADNLHAATLILIHSVSTGVLEAVSPNGFLIDYSNFYLVKTFTDELIKYLKKEKVTYLVTNPMFRYKVYDKNNYIVENNESLLNNLYHLNYRSIGYYSDFERYDIIIDNDKIIDDIYHNFNRNTKRNIKEGINFGITLHKGNYNDMPEIYKIIEKKTNKSLLYYQNLMNIYNTKDNKMEIFFAKLNPHTYLVNIQKLYENEKITNEKIHSIINKHTGNITDKMLNRKINSDKTVEKLHHELNYALSLNQQYQDDIIIGASIVIRNNHEIYFLVDGYKEGFKHIHSTHILKWAIIKKYHQLGYRRFNLGEVHKDYYNKDNKYHTQYLYKIGFGGNVIEYSPNLSLIINKPKYSLYKKIKHKKK